MKTGILLLILGSLSFIGNLQAQTQLKADLILGDWLNEDQDAKVTIYQQGDKFFGKVSWLKEPMEDDGVTPKIDDNNPNEKLATQPIMGLILLKEFKFNGDQWRNGTIYDPKNGKTYKCYIEYIDEHKLKIRGYIGQSWMGLGRTTYWTR